MKQLCAFWFAAMLFVAAVFGLCRYFGPAPVTAVHEAAKKPAAPTNLRIVNPPVKSADSSAKSDFRAGSHYTASWQIGFSGLIGAVGCATCHAEKIYRVKKGDNLTKITKRHVLRGWGSTYRQNRKVIGKNPNRIHPGQMLLIPQERYFVNNPSRASNYIGAEKQSKQLALAGCALSHPIPKEIAARVDCFLCHRGDAIAAEQARRLVTTRRAARSPSGDFLWKRPGGDSFGYERDNKRAIQAFAMPDTVKNLFIIAINLSLPDNIEINHGDRFRQMLFGDYKVVDNVVAAWRRPGMKFWASRWSLDHDGRRYEVYRPRICGNWAWKSYLSPAAPGRSLAPPPPEKPPPPLAHINAIPDNIAKGSCTRLYYITRNADNVSIDQGVGPVETTEGNRTVCPPDNTTYTIMAYGPGGQATDNTTVRVYEPARPPEPPPPKAKQQQAPSAAKAESTVKPGPCQWKPAWEGNVFTGVVVNAEGASSRVTYWGSNVVFFPEECYSKGTIWRKGPSVEAVGWRGFESRDGHVDFHGQKYVVGGEIQHLGRWFKDVYDIRLGRKDGWTSTPGGYQASEKTGILNLAFSHTRWFSEGASILKSWQFGIQGDLDLKNGLKSSSFNGSPISSDRDPRLNASEVAAHLRAEFASKGNWNPILQLDGTHAVGPQLWGIEPRAGLSYKNGLAEGLVGYRVNSGANNNTAGAYFNLSLDKLYDQLKAKLREENKANPALTDPVKVVK